jgi:uncharacterized integral membrane protein
MQKQFVFLLIVAILVAIFAITNAEVVAVRLFFWTFELSGSLLILISVALGALLVVLLNAVTWIKQRNTIKDLNRQLEKAHNQLEMTQAENVNLLQQIEAEKAKVDVAESESVQPEPDSISW